ncbi:MAG: helix-turn-helix domain-containing protein [Candidatus Ventricola sp.]
MRQLEKRVRALEGQMEDARKTNLESALVKEYGECVSKTDAAAIMGVTRVTVYAMIRDGRIRSAMGGRKVDVRSIARYIDQTGGKKDGTGIEVV